MMRSAGHQNYGSRKCGIGSPFGNALWPDLLRYQTIAVKYYSGMSGALHIRPKDACNF